MLEQEIEGRLVEGLEAIGCWVGKTQLVGRRGFPDRTVVLPGGQVVFVELKRPGGVLSRQQIDVIGELASRGARVVVLASIEEVEAFLSNLNEEVTR